MFIFTILFVTCLVASNFLQKVKASCDPNPCRNGGTCKLLGGSLSCECPLQGGYCKNSNQCCRWQASVACRCPPQWTGPYCGQLLLPPCRFNPCQNGGTCYFFESTEKCSCPFPFNGNHCEHYYDDWSFKKKT